MSNLRQAAQQALTDMKDLERTISALTGGKLSRLGDAIGRLEKALAEHDQEPQTTHWEGCEAVHPECKEKNT